MLDLSENDAGCYGHLSETHTYSLLGDLMGKTVIVCLNNVIAFIH